MPQPRKKRDNAASSQRKAKQTATARVSQAQAVPAPPTGSRELAQPRSQSQGEEGREKWLYTLLVVPILLLVVSNSLVAFLYLRALDPLYGSYPVNLHLEKVVWAATVIGGFGPVPSFWTSFAVMGVWIAAIPVSSYWTALYTGRIDNSAIGSTVTHLVVLFPIVYFGVSIVKRITVCIYHSFRYLFIRSQYLGNIGGQYVQYFNHALYHTACVCNEHYWLSTGLG